MSPDQMAAILQALVTLVGALAALIAAFKSGAAHTEAKAARVASEQAADTTATAIISSAGGVPGSAPGGSLANVLKYIGLATDVVFFVDRVKGAPKGEARLIPTIRARVNGRMGRLSKAEWEFEE